MFCSFKMSATYVLANEEPRAPASVIERSIYIDHLSPLMYGFTMQQTHVASGKQLKKISIDSNIK